MATVLTRAAGALCWGLLLVAVARMAPHSPEKTLNLYIWSAYLADDTLPVFEKRHGVKMSIDTYDSNEAVLAKLQAGNVDYDLVVPSDYMVEILVREKLLAPIDRASLRNVQNVGASFMDQAFDRGNRYSIPYFWGTTGIGYRKDKVGGEVDSWGQLWDPKFRDRITMLDDMRENFAAALKWKGRSLNTTSPAEIELSKALLLSQKPLIKAYNSGNFQEMLLSGDAWLAQGFNGQIAKAMKESREIGYAIPKEGCTRSIDSLCIPASAPHKELAHQFIDYVLEAEVAASLCNATGYSTPNQAARPFLAPAIRENAAIFPPAERLERCEFVSDIGGAVALYDKAWTEIKSR